MGNARGGNKKDYQEYLKLVTVNGHRIRIPRKKKNEGYDSGLYAEMTKKDKYMFFLDAVRGMCRYGMSVEQLVDTFSHYLEDHTTCYYEIRYKYASRPKYKRRRA